MSILCCCEDFAPSASPKCCVHTASSLMIRTYLASPRSWTDRRRVASVGHCSVRWRHVRRRNTFTCRAKRSIWRISLNELNQNSRESKSILWFRITGLWSFCVNLACYAFIKITLASCHLLLYVVYMCQKKIIKFYGCRFSFLSTTSSGIWNLKTQSITMDAFHCYEQKSVVPLNLAHPVYTNMSTLTDILCV